MPALGLDWTCVRLVRWRSCVLLVGLSCFAWGNGITTLGCTLASCVPAQSNQISQARFALEPIFIRLTEADTKIKDLWNGATSTVGVAELLCLVLGEHLDVAMQLCQRATCFRSTNPATAIHSLPQQQHAQSELVARASGISMSSSEY